ncbi:MAG: hypothetical protein ACI86M_000893 [Saprospiraceae bacterium]|jgi:hypothetical protein
MEQKYKDKYKPLDLEATKEKDFALINCPKCSCETPAANIDLSDKLAKCDNCNAIFSIKYKVVELQTVTLNEEIAKPVGVDILEYNGQLELTLDQPVSILHILSVSLSPFLAFMFLGVFASKGVALLAYLSAAFAFAFIFSLVSLIRYKRNKIFMTATQEELSIEYRPKNFVNDKFYSAKSIEQLFVTKDPHGLCLQMVINESEGQKTQKLIGRFSDITKAKYIEQEIEKFLGIKNKRVSGEEM